jgi:outer membrane protein TolC
MVTLIEPNQHIEDLVAMGLTNRPELAGQQALVQSTLARIRQEKMRPFLPSVVARGTSTSATGTLAGGIFGGGINDDMGNFGGRFDYDVQLLWELKELGFGNYALVRQRQAENEVAVLQLSRIQDRVAAEVVQAYAGVRSATVRVTESEAELKDAVESADKNLEGLSQTRSVGNVVMLVVRPQEVVASFQALAQAYADYYGAIADYDRAQFRLYHALGHPAQAVANHELTAEPPAPKAEVGPKP